MRFRRYRAILAAVSIFFIISLLSVSFTNTLDISKEFNDSGVDNDDSITLNHSKIIGETENIDIENPVWFKTYGPNYSQNKIRDTIECSDGGFCILGTLGNPDDIMYLADAILLKTDSDGNHLWNHTYGRSDEVIESTADVIECANGDFAFVGQQFLLDTSDRLGWLVRTNSTGHLKYNLTYPSSTSLVRLIELSSGDLFVSGAYYTNIFVMRTDENGTVIWSTPIASSLDDKVTDMIQSSTGEFIITGFSRQTSPHIAIPFLLKIDEDAVFHWYNHYTFEIDDTQSYSVIELDSGAYLMAGAMGLHLWFCEISVDGDRIWYKTIPTEFGLGIAMKPLDGGGYAVLTSLYRITFVDEQFKPIGECRYDISPSNSFVLTQNNEFVIGGYLKISNNYTLALLREPLLQWNETVTDISAEYLQPISRDFNATCSQNIDEWTVNATSFFDIDSNGVLTNNSVLDVGIYPITVMVNDTLENTLSQEFLVTVEDTTSPEWVQIPENQLLELSTTLSYDLNAYDPSGVSYWSLNASGLFDINEVGLITNIHPLEVGSYGLMVTVGDIYNNELTSEFSLTVSDSIGPIWIIAPSDVTATEGQDIEMNIAASDLSGIDSWICNDTVKFQIAVDSTQNAGSCLITNASALDVGSYGLNLTVTDLYGNRLSSTFTITIIEIPVVTSTTTTTTTTTTSITTTDTTTTSTTTTTQTSEPALQTAMLVAAGSGWGVAILVIVVMLKRRS